MYGEDRCAHNWLIKKLLTDKVRARLPTLSGLVLDPGCGTRPFEPGILRFANAYIGVDWGETPDELKADAIVDLNQPLRFSDCSVDRIVSFEVLEHLAGPAVMPLEACRVLRSGGTSQ